MILSHLPGRRLRQQSKTPDEDSANSPFVSSPTFHNSNNSVRLNDSDSPDKNSSSLTSDSSSSSNNFKVAIRVRPPLPRELASGEAFRKILSIDRQGRHVTACEYLSDVIDEDGHVAPPAGFQHPIHSFVFDYAYDEHTSQQVIYDNVAHPLVDSSLQGYNATIFAYGQTGTGKTYTMEGRGSSMTEESAESRGIIPRAIEQVFGFIRNLASAKTRFLVRASYLQIYNEQISDLLKQDRQNLAIREDKKKGVFVENLSEWVVRSPTEIYGLIQRGSSLRTTGETKMNEISSRSHAVFIVIIEQSNTIYLNDAEEEISSEEFTAIVREKAASMVAETGADGLTSTQMMKSAMSSPEVMRKLEKYVRQSFKVGKLNLVDLAGSERVKLSGVTGQRLEEAKKINQSLSALLGVIIALTDPRGRRHIPYRDSKLTRLLEDSLGGNCKTTMVAMLSPSSDAYLESVNTLKFANTAKNIKNDAKVNEDADQKSLLRKYEKELKRLREELANKNQSVVDHRRLLDLEEQRRRAEADKMAAIRALEARSLEFMREKEDKKRLEGRITELTSQVIGAQQLIQQQQMRMQGMDHNSTSTTSSTQSQESRIVVEYEGKLADLERERVSIEEEKAQVDRYKSLLLKQRDIMIALTQRLNERDEQIMSLQDEVEIFENRYHDLEEKLDEKTTQLIHLERIVMECGDKIPAADRGYLLGNLGMLSSSSSQSSIRPSSSHDNDVGANRVRELESVINRQKQEISGLVERQHQQLTLSMQQPSLPPPPAAGDSQEMIAKLLREKQAITSILDNKIRLLSDNIASLALDAANGGSPADITRSLTQEAAALQRLVNAAVMALKSSSETIASRPSSSSNSHVSQASNASRPVAEPVVMHKPTRIVSGTPPTSAAVANGNTTSNLSSRRRDPPQVPPGK